jgi:tubulin polyglutamylase TTLL9
VEATNGLFNNIQNLIIRALLAVQPAMISDKHCFEVC